MTQREDVDAVGPLLDSVRSTRSSYSIDSDSTNGRRMERLQGNLMRAQQSRDPLLIYEVIEIMGEGSMGSVSRVRKRSEAVGGSARAAFVVKHGSDHGSMNKCCFGWLEFLKLPSQKNLIDSSRTDDTTTIATSDASVNRSSTTATNNRKTYRQQSSIVKYDTNKESFYALKSIHLDRCSTKEYVDELKVCTNGTQECRKVAEMIVDVDRYVVVVVVVVVVVLNSLFFSLPFIYLLSKLFFFLFAHLFLSKLFKKKIQNEVAILRNIDHPHIVRAIETFDYKNRLYMVLELCSGGDLYTREPYTEGAAQVIVKALFSAVSYLHARGIVHRDVSF